MFDEPAQARGLALEAPYIVSALRALLDNLSIDYRKILEPVVCAERKGYGFIEAAEIYSGFLGDLN